MTPTCFPDYILHAPTFLILPIYLSIFISIHSCEYRVCMFTSRFACLYSPHLQDPSSHISCTRSLLLRLPPHTFMEDANSARPLAKLVGKASHQAAMLK